MNIKFNIRFQNIALTDRTIRTTYKPDTRETSVYNYTV